MLTDLVAAQTDTGEEAVQDPYHFEVDDLHTVAAAFLTTDISKPE